MSLKETKMPEGYTILSPLPQLILKRSIPDKVQDILRKEGFCFSPMTPELYRTIMDRAKEHNCSDDIITLLQESGVIFWAQLPHPWPMQSSPVVSGAYYTIVAEAILKRLFDCLLLFGYIPKPLRRYFWVIASGVPEKIDINALTLTEPDWNYYDWEIKYSEPAGADMLIMMLQSLFDKLSPILEIKQLNAAFTDEIKQKGYLSAGNKNIRAKTEELLKLRYGPDAHFADDDLQNESCCGSEKSKILPPLSSQKLSAKWFFEGYNRAYFNEIEKLDRKLYKDASGQRFIRAFQFFTDACRLSNPHKFVALTTPLETLFCATSREITFQLSSRIAWFLEPDDFIKRNKLFTDVKDLYDTRSKIVHGGKYDASKVENTVGDLEDLDRRVFFKILSCDPIYKMIFDKNQKSWEQYLDGLNLGISRNGGKD